MFQRKAKPHEYADPQFDPNSEQSAGKHVVEGRNGLLVVDPENNPEIVGLVQQVREKLVAEVELNPDLYPKSEVQLLKDGDYFIRRYLYPNDLDPEATFEQVKRMLLWRKEMGFDGASDQRFPMEFYQIGALFPYMTDKDGTLLLYMRFKVYKKLDVLIQPIKQFLAYHMDKLDKSAAKERSWAVVFDTRGAGITNVDFDMLIFLIKTVKFYFPWGMKYVLVYELSWLLEGAWRVCQSLLPDDASRLFKFHNKDTITNLIEAESLPDFMGGTCELDYRAVPEGCKPAEEVAVVELGLTPEDVAKLKKHFEKHFSDINRNTTIRQKSVTE